MVTNHAAVCQLDCGLFEINWVHVDPFIAMKLSVEMGLLKVMMVTSVQLMGYDERNQRQSHPIIRSLINLHIFHAVTLFEGVVELSGKRHP
jgi:hypothetical protein